MGEENTTKNVPTTNNNSSKTNRDSKEDWINLSFWSGIKTIWNCSDPQKGNSEKESVKSIFFWTLGLSIVIGVIAGIVEWLWYPLEDEILDLFCGTVMTAISVLTAAAFMAMPLVLNNPVFSKFDPRPTKQKKVVIGAASLQIMAQLLLIGILIVVDCITSVFPCGKPVMFGFYFGVLSFCVISDLKIILQIVLYAIPKYNDNK